MKNIFTDTKTFYGFQNKEVSDETLHEIYELVKNNATSFNCQPLRIKFLKSDQAKQRLKPSLMEGNLDKTMKAPVCAILA
ncbi:MAG: nitroreductase family protein, partial [Pelagibacteraceae bacterium]